MPVHHALLRRPHDDRLRFLQGRKRGLTVAAGDRLFDLAQIGAHPRSARLVDVGAARDLARGLLGGFGIRHLVSTAPGTTVPPTPYRHDEKKSAAVSPPRAGL